MAIFAYCPKCNRNVHAIWATNDKGEPIELPKGYKDNDGYGIAGGPCYPCIRKKNKRIRFQKEIDLEVTNILNDVYEKDIEISSRI